ncbi:conserved hypothetical protein [Altererythrobacter sp. B11]|nr:conserved hypothetical protein [Altererythrobacter sp. B11]
MLGAAMALGACGGSGAAKAKGGTLGPVRTVTWAVGTTGSDFVTDISVGAADAADMLGWRFDRILNALATPDAHINAIRTAVTSRADVVLTVDWYQAVIDEIAAGQKGGTHFAVVNSANNPAELEKLNVPFVGLTPKITGKLMGRHIADELAARGISQGSVLVGNPFPGSLNVEERIAGVREGLAEVTGGLRMVTFPDNAATDSALAVGLYKAKITETADVVAHAAAGGEMSTIPLTKALAELGKRASGTVVGGWVSSLKSLTLLKNGELTFALDENLYYQGFLAVLASWSMLERGMPAGDISPGFQWVTPKSVDAVIDSYQRRKAAAEAYGLS